jgi:hypothetical protein
MPKWDRIFVRLRLSGMGALWIRNWRNVKTLDGVVRGELDVYVPKQVKRKVEAF